MLNKKTAIFFLTVAYAILLLHNIIPHHHHDNIKELTEHHHSDHHDHDTDHKGLSHLLSHFIHSADSFTFPTNHNITNTFTKQQLSFVAVLPNNFSPDDFLIPPLLNNSYAEQVIYISPHSHPSGLRAPPATFI